MHTGLVATISALATLVLVASPIPTHARGLASTIPHFDESFAGLGAGTDPPGWIDTAAGNSLSSADDFEIFLVDGDPAIGTTSTLINIHSHYAVDGSAWSGYVFRGRLRIDHPDGGIGVTFYSSYPESDDYLRLRRHQDLPGHDPWKPEFHFEGHGIGPLVCDTVSTGVTPIPGQWYAFEIEAESDGAATTRRARVWPEGTPVPAWQHECVDASAGRPTEGTIGVWSMGPGAKYWDDFSVRVLCTSDAECDDRLTCTGARICEAGECTAAIDPCLGTAEPYCDERADRCRDVDVSVADPLDEDVLEGETAIFQVVDDPGPSTYQWQRWNASSWADIAGATAKFHRTGPTAREDDGALYRCEVTHPNGVVETAAASLSVDPRPHGFIDHFSTGTIDASRWTTTTVGDGSLDAASGEYLAITSPQLADASSARYLWPIDPSESQTWLFSIRRVGSGDAPDLISLSSPSNGQPPGIGAAATLASELRASIGTVADAGTSAIRFRYRPSSAGTRSWAGIPTNAWSAAGVSANAIAPIREGPDADWYVVGFQIDGEGERLRFVGAHRAGVGSTIEDPSQGIRLSALTDWVEFSEFDATAPIGTLWLTLGDRETDATSGEVQIEWIRREAGPLRHAYSNAKTGGAGIYELRHQFAFGDQFLPDDRGAGVFSASQGAWDAGGYRHKNLVRDEDGTYYLFYEGFDALGRSSIGLASAPDAAGPWSRSPLNPVVGRSLLPGGGLGYDVLTAPWAIIDSTDPDPQRRWKLLAVGEVDGTSTHRVFLFDAPDPEGPWTRASGPGPDDSVLGESGEGGWRNDGNSNPVVWWDASALEWKGMFGGIEAGEGWSIGLLTSPDLVDWTEDPANPLVGGGSGGVSEWTGLSGNRVIVSDPSGFEPDGIVVIRNQPTQEGVALSRIRKIDGNALELYHRIDGLTGLDPGRLVSMLGADSMTPHAVFHHADGRYSMQVSAFQPYLRATGSFANLEISARMTAPSLVGPWRMDHLSNVVTSLNPWGASSSNENLAFAQGTMGIPLDGDPVPEPGLGIALSAGLMAIGLIADHRRRR